MLKRKCWQCKKEIKYNWQFCPFCGVNLNKNFENSFERLFNDISKMLAVSLSSLPQNISITLDDSNEFAEEIEKNQNKRKLLKLPKIIEEPKTEIKSHKNKFLIFVKLPNIKKLKDVDVKIFGQSLEIRALAKDKGYFKIVPLPSKYEIINKVLEGDILKIELEKS
ncbi:MAG: zinc ribbon domain-containing protein [Candidatus Nanoarchaeia archaeon]